MCWGTKSTLSPLNASLSRKTKNISVFISFKSRKRAVVPISPVIFPLIHTQVSSFHLFNFHWVVPFLNIFHVHLQHSHLCVGCVCEKCIQVCLSVQDCMHAYVNVWVHACGWVCICGTGRFVGQTLYYHLIKKITRSWFLLFSPFPFATRILAGGTCGYSVYPKITCGFQILDNVAFLRMKKIIKY